jgi:hypothetical protein
MGLRYANPLRSEFHEPSNMKTIQEHATSNNLFIKFYPKFFKREDVHSDFVAVQRELKVTLPDARIIKEDVDSSCARIQFDIPPSQEVILERVLAKRGFVQANRTR